MTFHHLCIEEPHHSLLDTHTQRYGSIACFKRPIGTVHWCARGREKKMVISFIALLPVNLDLSMCVRKCLCCVCTWNYAVGLECACFVVLPLISPLSCISIGAHVYVRFSCGSLSKGFCVYEPAPVTRQLVLSLCTCSYLWPQYAK